jgi:hypothetical protein
MPKWAIILAAAIIVGGVFLSYFGLGTRGDDKQQILVLIGDVEQAANARDWGRVLSHVSADYKDKTGMTKDSLRGLAMQASRLDRVRVQTKVEGVTVSDKNRATVLLRLSVGRNEGGAASFDVMIVLQKTGTWWQQFMGHGWQVTDAEGWQSAVGPTE